MPGSLTYPAQNLLWGDSPGLTLPYQQNPVPSIFSIPWVAHGLWGRTHNTAVYMRLNEEQA
jgi:hypothetical protein